MSKIDELTIGEAREMTRMFGSGGQGAEPPPHPHVGRYCVFRGYRTGVYVGYLDGSCMGGAYHVVRDARRVQYQKYNGFTLCSVATGGLHESSKLSPPIPLQTLRADDICEVFACDDEVARTIQRLPNATP